MREQTWMPMWLKAPAEVVYVTKSAPISRQENPFKKLGGIALTIVLNRVLFAEVTPTSRSYEGVGMDGASLAQFAEGIRDCPGALVLENRCSIVPNTRVVVPEVHCVPKTFNQSATKLLLRHRLGWLRGEADGGESEGHGDGQGAEERTKSCCLHM